jgi:hypothetical protein
MRMMSVVCGVAVAAAMCGGCLRKEVASTIYVAPGGTMWTVVERNVRSDEKAPADRIVEESDYYLAAAAGKHSVAQAFRRLGAQSVTTTWLRRERPYTVMTEARFGDLRQLATAILRDAGAQGDVSLVRDGCDTAFGVKVDVDSPDNTALDALLTDLENYRFVLADGRFTSADGFRILDEGTIAVWDGNKTATDGILTLALGWTSEGCVTKR